MEKLYGGTAHGSELSWESGGMQGPSPHTNHLGPSSLTPQLHSTQKRTGSPGVFRDVPHWVSATLPYTSPTPCPLTLSTAAT